MTNVVPFIPNTLSLDEHVKLISETWKQTSLDYIDGIIKTGQRLVAAQLEHGEVLRAMADKLPFHWATANKLIVIAKWNVAPGQHEKLPAAWTILYELTKLPEKVMLDALNDGRIHPNMSRKTATDLKPKKRGRNKPFKTVKENPPSPDKPLALDLVCKAFVKATHKLSKKQRKEEIQKLMQAVDLRQLQWIADKQVVNKKPTSHEAVIENRARYLIQTSFELNSGKFTDHTVYFYPGDQSRRLIGTAIKSLENAKAIAQADYDMTGGKS